MSFLRALGVCAISYGCAAAPSVRSRHLVDAPLPASVAVLPFANLSGDAAAAAAVPSQILNELVRHGKLRVFDLTGSDSKVLTDRNAAALGAAHEVEAVLVGSVVEYEYLPARNAAGVPSITLHARLIAVRDARVIWRGTAAATAGDLWSSERVALETLAQRVAAAVVSDLVSGLKGAEPAAVPAQVDEGPRP